MLKTFITLERHRRFQIIITLGIISSAVLSIMIPEFNHISSGLAILTNMIWIWE